MPVFRISGIGELLGDTGGVPSITVDKAKAEINFLIMVNNNFFNLKTILNSDMDKLYGEVKNWYIGQGFDFNQLLAVLK